LEILQLEYTKFYIYQTPFNFNDIDVAAELANLGDKCNDFSFLIVNFQIFS